MQSNGTTMTVQDVLKQVYDILNGINISVAEVERIGVPLSKAASGLKACIDACEKDIANDTEPAEGEIISLEKITGE